MPHWLRSRYFWLWFAFWQSTVIVFNAIGMNVKGFRFFGRPFFFAYWRPGLPIEWEFEPFHLFLDAVIGTALAFFVALGLTALHSWHNTGLSSGKPAEPSGAITDR